MFRIIFYFRFEKSHNIYRKYIFQIKKKKIVFKRFIQYKYLMNEKVFINTRCIGVGHRREKRVKLNRIFNDTVIKVEVCAVGGIIQTPLELKSKFDMM